MWEFKANAQLDRPPFHTTAIAVHGVPRYDSGKAPQHCVCLLKVFHVRIQGVDERCHLIHHKDVLGSLVESVVVPVQQEKGDVNEWNFPPRDLSACTNETTDPSHDHAFRYICHPSCARNKPLDSLDSPDYYPFFLRKRSKLTLQNSKVCLIFVDHPAM